MDIVTTIRRDPHYQRLSPWAWDWDVTGPWGHTGLGGWTRTRIGAHWAARRARHQLEDQA